MPEIAAFGFMGSQASQGLFGANVLATRSTLEQGGDYDRLIEDLGVGSFRYPGGSLTERYFDIANPNASVVADRDTGELRDFIPMNEALSYAGQADLGVTVVIPTRNLLSEDTDANGDRFSAIDEPVLRDFVRDVVSGVHGDARIDGFELGNEYWGSGQMSSIEYGRLASEMAVIVNDELELAESDAEIIVQSGTNFNFARMSDDYPEDMSSADILADLNETYGLSLDEGSIFSSGQVNWTNVANEMILSEFDTADEQDSVDQVAVHVYSRGQVNESQRSFFLNDTDETWGEQIPEAQIAVTEWNTAGNTGALDRGTDYGLYQSHEMLNVMEEFLRYDVEQAHVWPLIQNTPNTLSVDDGQADLSPAGAMFNMMQDALPGKRAIDLTPESGADTEVEEDDLSVHGFWEPDEILFYMAATGEDGADTGVDLSDMVSEPGRVEISVLGVAEGEDAGSSASTSRVTDLDPDEVMDGTAVSVQLGQGEIMQVRMFGFTPSQDFQDVISEQAPETLPDPLIEAASDDAEADTQGDDDAAADTQGGNVVDFPTVAARMTDADPVDADDEATDAAEETSDDNDMGGLVELLAMVPILGLMAMFM